MTQQKQREKKKESKKRMNEGTGGRSGMQPQHRQKRSIKRKQKRDE